MALLKNIKNTPLVKFFSSVKITVACLFFLFVLTLLGTIDQVYNGLYHAQHKFFYSWVFLLFDFLPFPGTKLILTILFINLCSVAIARFVYHFSHLGICIIHFGLLTYFISAFLTYKICQETNIQFKEGEGSNVSTAYSQWELSVWKEEGKGHKDIIAYDDIYFKPPKRLAFPEFGFEALIKAYYPNAEAYSVNDAPNADIQTLKPVKSNKDPEKNLPGLILELNSKQASKMDIVLYGGESQPKQITLGNQVFHLLLRKKRAPLPFMITLKDFRMQKHPNTEIAKSYESDVVLEHDNLKREVKIYMNHPLRYKDFTLYQASYAIDEKGREYSTLAVVQNKARLLPYFSSLITFLGLVIHFLMMAFQSKRKIYV